MFDEYTNVSYGVQIYLSKPQIPVFHMNLRKMCFISLNLLIFLQLLRWKETFKHSQILINKKTV